MTEPTNGTRFRLDELARRAGELADELHEIIEKFRERFHKIEGDIAGVNLICNRFPDVERRVQELEGQNVAVLARDVRWLERRVDSMARALWTAAGALVIAAVTFALAVASGQI